MSATTLLLYLFMALTAFSAAAIAFSKNVFKSALWLLMCLLSVGGLYVFLFAEFLAVTQVLVYAGGILVVIIFGIMLTTRLAGRPLAVENAHIFSGALAGLLLLGLLVRYLPATAVAEGPARPGAIPVIALEIFSQYFLPFELAGLLLLIALTGAAVITAQLKSKT